MSGIFRKKIVKSDSFDYVPVTSTQMENRNVVKDGVTTTFVDVVVKDMNQPVLMPTKEEFDLETQLKAGINPQEINVHGILPSDDGSFDYVSAFNSLQSQIDSMNVNNKTSDDVKE